MIELVVDASVATKWFRDEQEEHRTSARELLARYLAGEIVLAAPPLFYLELLKPRPDAGGGRPIASISSPIDSTASVSSCGSHRCPGSRAGRPAA
jgi:hypothetical protein